VPQGIEQPDDKTGHDGELMEHEADDHGGVVGVGTHPVSPQVEDDVGEADNDDGLGVVFHAGSVLLSGSKQKGNQCILGNSLGSGWSAGSANI